jgi:hypothetical protein
MRSALALLAVVTAGAGVARAAAAWTPTAWAAENTVELRTTDPGEEPHWFPVWVAVVDGQLYVRLGDRAAGRFERNLTKPVIAVRIAGHEFDRVRGIPAPDQAPTVAATMHEKYWGDLLVQYANHPLTLRLEPVPDAE